MAATNRLPTASAVLLMLLAGCGSDPKPRPPHVAVPDRDSSPPSAKVELVLPSGDVGAKASQPGATHPQPVVLRSRDFKAVATGTDGEGGIARVRISTQQQAVCVRSGGRLTVRRHVRYYPPPQIERIRSSAGARLPTERRRRVALVAGRGPCPGGTQPAEVQGQVWAEAINGLGLEAVTPHIRFSWKR